MHFKWTLMVSSAEKQRIPSQVATRESLSGQMLCTGQMELVSVEQLAWQAQFCPALKLTRLQRPFIFVPQQHKAPTCPLL